MIRGVQNSTTLSEYPTNFGTFGFSTDNIWSQAVTGPARRHISLGACGDGSALHYTAWTRWMSRQIQEILQSISIVLNIPAYT